MAPIFLWPISITVNPKRQWSFTLQRGNSNEAPEFNSIMAAWAARIFNVSIESPEVPPDDVHKMPEALRRVFSGLDGLDVSSFDGPLEPVPRKRSIADRSPVIIHAGILGLMRWQNQAIMDDIERLLNFRTYAEVFEGLFLNTLPRFCARLVA